MRNQDKFRGCLIGGATGDALGYAVEFLREKRIFQKYGSKGITEYDLTDGVAQFSDDTQMTLFTAAGLLSCAARDDAGGWTNAINQSYLDWLHTQDTSDRQNSRTASWLANVPGLYHRRAPGNACQSALYAGGGGTIEKPINNSKGCGGVMRVAPIGLYFNDRNWTPEQVARLGADTAALTHGNPLGWMPAAALVQIIHEVSQDNVNLLEAVMHSLKTIDEIYPESKEKDYFTGLIEKAVDLASEDTDDLTAIHQLGEGWDGEEALAIAVYCALKYTGDFDKALIAAVNHNGDSDSTGAITGNIIGARVGLSGIPEKYIERLELKDLILEIADDLWYGRRITENSELDPVWKLKYVDAAYIKPEW